MNLPLEILINFLWQLVLSDLKITGFSFQPETARYRFCDELAKGQECTRSLPKVSGRTSAPRDPRDGISDGWYILTHWRRLTWFMVHSIMCSHFIFLLSLEGRNCCALPLEAVLSHSMLSNTKDFSLLRWFVKDSNMQKPFSSLLTGWLRLTTWLDLWKLLNVWIDFWRYG